jgi:hypothetical protein
MWSYKLVSCWVLVAGRVPERLLFPRNLIQTYFWKEDICKHQRKIILRYHAKTISSNSYIKLSEVRLKIDRGIWPVILLKLKSLHQWNKDY